jgi:hypothetical protein
VHGKISFVDAERQEICVASRTGESKFIRPGDEKRYVNSFIFLTAAKYFKLESEN